MGEAVNGLRSIFKSKKQREIGKKYSHWSLDMCSNEEARSRGYDDSQKGNIQPAKWGYEEGSSDWNSYMYGVDQSIQDAECDSLARGEGVHWGAPVPTRNPQPDRSCDEIPF